MRHELAQRVKTGFWIGFPTVLLAVLYSPVLSALVKAWREDKSYSHGFLVIPISLFLAWVGRDRWIGLTPRPSRTVGWGLIGAACFMLLVGQVGGVILLGELSLVVMAAGLVAAFLGTAHLRALWLPVVYLLFMVPLMDAASDRIHWPFQILSARMAVAMLQSLGYAAHLDRQYIFLPNITLEVAEACSGLRYLISIVAIGIPVATVTLTGWARRAGLVGAAVGIAILANGLRVLFIGVVAYDGRLDIHGPFHIFQGMVVSWIGLIALFVGAWWLGRGRVPRPRLALSKLNFKPHPATFRAAWIGATALLLATASYPVLMKPSPVPLGDPAAGLPWVAADWNGRRADPSEAVVRASKPDHEIVMRYRRSMGGEVSVYIGYFESQQQGQELVSYDTEPFHRDADLVRIGDAESGSAFDANRKTIRKDGRPYLVLFWYDVNGRRIADPYRVKLWTLWDVAVHRHSHGALIAVSVTLDPSEGKRDPLSEMTDLIGWILPAMRVDLRPT
jgi:EpsI family protein